MRIILISVVAGVLGTGLGGTLTVLLGYRTEKAVSTLLSFAGGVMISIVFYELIPEAIELANTWITVLGIAIGVSLTLLLETFLDRVPVHAPIHLHHDKHDHRQLEQPGHIPDHQLLHSGLLMLLVIGLHNLPEGLALGAAADQNNRLSITLALLIAIHNVPLGMAIAAPLVSGGLPKTKAVTLTFIAGTPTVLGAIIGAFLGGISSLSLSLALSLAGGAMLYAVFGEFLPQATSINQGRIPTIIQLAGIICGMLFTGVHLH